MKIACGADYSDQANLPGMAARTRSRLPGMLLSPVAQTALAIRGRSVLILCGRKREGDAFNMNPVLTRNGG